MKHVGIVSLGCAKNLIDSENILGLLDKNRYQVVSDFHHADIIIINTCGFIESAKKESIDTIISYLTYEKPLVVVGCLVERYLEDLKKELPEVALFIPIHDYPRFNQLLAKIDQDITDKEGLSYQYRIVSTGPHSAYIRIGEGCDNRCSYCAIPLIRGKFVSRPMEEIIQEAYSLSYAGYKELTIIEQDTSKYGIDFKGQNITIVTLLKNLLKYTNFSFIRLLYLYPDEISDELIDLMMNEPRILMYFDVPIQHSEDHILRDMNRRGNKEFLKALFNKIRNINDKAVLRTTLLVGFPNETEEDIDGLEAFIKEVEFDHIGIFTYSKEEDTPAYDFPNQVPSNIANKRKDRLMKVAQTISYRRNKKRVGEEMNALIVGKENNYYLVRTYWNAPDDVDGKIYIKSDIPHEMGDLIDIKITNAYVYDLMGEELIK